jgi:hypothetical protein
MIKAQSLDGKIIEVTKHKGGYYAIGPLGYVVFTPNDKCPKGHEYRHYIINGGLYESTHTNTLNIITESSDYTLFDLE